MLTEQGEFVKGANVECASYGEYDSYLSRLSPEQGL